MPEHLPDDLVQLQQRISRFASEELAPLEAALGPETSIPLAIREEVRRRSRAQGLWDLTLPAELGGAAVGRLARVVAREALARTNLRLARIVLAPDPGPLAGASGEQRNRYLLPVVRGERRCAFAFTEPASARRPTTARREGDTLVLDGDKSYVTGGLDADLFAVVTRVEGTPGAGLVIVEREDRGLSVGEEFRSLDGSGHVSLHLEDVRLPIDRVIGALGEGLPRALRSIEEVRLELAAEAVGIAIWTLEHLEQKLRAPHRSGSSLGEREGVRLRYAELRILAYAARSTLYRTARLAEGGEDVRNEIMASKVLSTETVGLVVDQALQLSGGQALVVGHPLERLYRRVRVMRLTEGANDLLRLQLARGRLDYEAGRI